MAAMGIGNLAAAMREKFAGKKGIDGRDKKSGKPKRKHYGRPSRGVTNPFRKQRVAQEMSEE